MIGNIGVHQGRKHLALLIKKKKRKNQERQREENTTTCVSSYQQMFPFILSVLIQLTVQILNHINVIVFQPHALDYPCLPVDFTCLLLLVWLSHECYVWSCLNSRWYLIKNTACCRAYLFCFVLYFTVTLQYISLSQQHRGLLAGYSSMNAYFLSIFASWSHLVTIHSCLEYYCEKDYQASSEVCFT